MHLVEGESIHSSDFKWFECRVLGEFRGARQQGEDGLRHQPTASFPGGNPWLGRSHQSHGQSVAQDRLDPVDKQQHLHRVYVSHHHGFNEEAEAQCTELSAGRCWQHQPPGRDQIPASWWKEQRLAWHLLQVLDSVDWLLDQPELSQGESANIERPILAADQDDLCTGSSWVQSHLPDPDLDYSHEWDRNDVCSRRWSHSELLLLSSEDFEATLAWVAQEGWRLEDQKVIRRRCCEKQWGVLDRRHAIWLSTNIANEWVVESAQEAEHLLEARWLREATVHIFPGRI